MRIYGIIFLITQEEICNEYENSQTEIKVTDEDNIFYRWNGIRFHK
jgi:hypothetical protein